MGPLQAVEEEADAAAGEAEAVDNQAEEDAESDWVSTVILDPSDIDEPARLQDTPCLSASRPMCCRSLLLILRMRSVASVLGKLLLHSYSIFC